ncbi:MAG: presqualene diphosphate synthase HpnD [Gammaproteobacteria bacterium]|nr:presqualene diphosphate synthase HpnD [Gammaproteobacteria bacterium]
MTPYHYCQDLVRRTRSHFLASVLFLPRLKKEALIVLYAFCRAVDDSVDKVSDKALARMKLLWWRQEVHKMFEGNAEHPIGLAFQEKIKPFFELSPLLFFEIISGMEMDIQHDPYQTFEDLKLYCYRVAGAVGICVATILGYESPNTERYAKHLGIALQLINIIRDVGEDGSRGRLYLPLQDCGEYQVTPQEIFNRKWSESLARLLAFQGERARKEYAVALSLLAPCDKSGQKPGQIMAAIYFCLLSEIERAGWNTLHYRISLPHWRQMWVALKSTFST